MGKAEEALLSIAYSAAKLSDRHNYPHPARRCLGDDPPSQTGRGPALRCGFCRESAGGTPSDFHEQRLLPKVMMNLVDNAFAAVAYQDKGVVRLTWSADDQGRRLLKVSNNGPEINSLDGKRIFRAGVTSKKDPSGNHGWGPGHLQAHSRRAGRHHRLHQLTRPYNLHSNPPSRLSTEAGSAFRYLGR